MNMDEIEMRRKGLRETQRTHGLTESDLNQDDEDKRESNFPSQSVRNRVPYGANPYTGAGRFPTRFEEPIKERNRRRKVEEKPSPERGPSILRFKVEEGVKKVAVDQSESEEFREKREGVVKTKAYQKLLASEGGIYKGLKRHETPFIRGDPVPSNIISKPKKGQTLQQQLQLLKKKIWGHFHRRVVKRVQKKIKKMRKQKNKPQTLAEHVRTNKKIVNIVLRSLLAVYLGWIFCITFLFLSVF